jgi:hypothetical protein
MGKADSWSPYRQKQGDSNPDRGFYEDMQKRPRIAERLPHGYSRPRGENRMTDINL